MTKLTTHVLDIYSGKPGAGIKVELYYLLFINYSILYINILSNDKINNSCFRYLFR